VYQNQEAFIRMINESEGDELGEEMAEGLDQPGVIQVSPQDKEAIERVGTFLLQMFCRREYRYIIHYLFVPSPDKKPSIFALKAGTVASDARKYR
jgi:hypothetical protein